MNLRTGANWTPTCAWIGSAEAKQLAEKLRAQGLGGARIHQRFLEIAYVEGDDAAAAREIQWFAGKPAEYLSFGLQAANQNALGPASRVEQTVPASRGDSAAPWAPECRRRI